jgi:hypothetical protein
LSLSGFNITVAPQEGDPNAEASEQFDHRKIWAEDSPAHYTRETITFHYTQPMEMLAIHERALHEKLDRMLNAGEAMAPALAAWLASFQADHLTVMRRKQQHIDWLCGPEGGSEAQRAAMPTGPLPNDMRSAITEHMTQLRRSFGVVLLTALQSLAPGNVEPRDIPVPKTSAAMCARPRAEPLDFRDWAKMLREEHGNAFHGMWGDKPGVPRTESVSDPFPGAADPPLDAGSSRPRARVLNEPWFCPDDKFSVAEWNKNKAALNKQWANGTARSVKDRTWVLACRAITLQPAAPRLL